MSSQITAALIAVVGTVVVAVVGFLTTLKVAKGTIHAGHEDTATILAAQSDPLERTLAEQHARTLNERFATAADKLGSDKSPAVRLAGVNAMGHFAPIGWMVNVGGRQSGWCP